MQTKIINADSMEHLKTLDENIFDSCVTDPPYHLASIVKRFGPGQKPINNRDTKLGINGPYHNTAKGFMGQTWDGGDIAFNKDFWKEVYRVMKPGAVLLAFAAPRNYHRMGVAIEDSGFEIFDMINWIYGSGFPKRRNLLKPAHEPIVMARKGVNKDLNLDECRVGDEEIDTSKNRRKKQEGTIFKGGWSSKEGGDKVKGRWPANVMHGGLEEDWAKYFYSPKASKKEKEDTKHPTVKPIALMRYLIKLVTPKEGLVLDPFAGTGTTGEACILEDRVGYLIEKEKSYIIDIEKRLGKHNELLG